MREREEEEGKERRGTREKKKKTRGTMYREKWDTQRRSALPYLFCLGAMVRRISRCTKESCLQFFDDKVHGGRGEGGGGELREPWVFRYGRRLQKVVRHEGKELHATLACRNFSRSERWGGRGGRGREKGCTPRRISIPGWNKYPKEVPSGILCVHRLIDSTNPITDCEIAKCVFFVFEIETVYRDRDSGFE